MSDGRPAALLHGIRVVELGHIVAGPMAGLIFAELGAEVIKVERPGVGDQARFSRGNQGYFLAFNACKRSIELDLKHALGRDAFVRLLRITDVVIDNYGPGVLARLGFGYEEMAKLNPRLIHCGIRGFLDGPYADRTLLDEPAQMMGGLAYMTGPRGMPLRAGASVIDIAGALCSVISILSALRRRQETGHGLDIRTGLFETVVFLMSQHIAKVGMTGEVPPPMPERGVGRDLGWGIYQIFETQDARHVFIGVTSDAQWKSFCREFGLDDLWADTRLRNNAGRRSAFAMLTARTAELARSMSCKDLIAKLEHANLPHAPVNTPLDLLEHPHLKARQQFDHLTAPDGTSADIPTLPFEFVGLPRRRLSNPPKLGEHTGDILRELGFSAAEIRCLQQGGA